MLSSDRRRAVKDLLEAALQYEPQRAETAFRAADMAHYLSACEYRRRALLGTERGQALIASAKAWATSQGVVNPPRIFDMLAPGRWERV